MKNSPAILGESDRTLLEITVVLKAKLEAGNIENSQITQLIQCLTKLGMISAGAGGSADREGRGSRDEIDA